MVALDVVGRDSSLSSADQFHQTGVGRMNVRGEKKETKVTSCKACWAATNSRFKRLSYAAARIQHPNISPTGDESQPAVPPQSSRDTPVTATIV